MLGNDWNSVFVLSDNALQTLSVYPCMFFLLSWTKNKVQYKW